MRTANVNIGRGLGRAAVVAALIASTGVVAGAARADTHGPAAEPLACPANLAQSLRSTGSATQIVTVRASTFGTTYATLRTWHKSGGCWSAVTGRWTARIGRGGLSDHHREGDGTTPTGAYAIGSVMYGIAPNPGVHYSYHHLVCGDWWDEDPNSPHYNSFQHVTCGRTPPFGGASEALWKETTAYRSFAVIRYNMNPAVPGRGSGIFLHDDVGGPTAGCVSLPPSELIAVLRWLQPGSSPLVVIGTSGEIRGF
jgi:L,D-peptidoglycan transpeptidase YkuD (ErfK/YbiS/YcfS/YnhG family)